jgi:hypothetical protein
LRGAFTCLPIQTPARYIQIHLRPCTTMTINGLYESMLILCSVPAEIQRQAIIVNTSVMLTRANDGSNDIRIYVNICPGSRAPIDRKPVKDHAGHV